MVRVAGSGFSRLFDLKKGVKQGSAMSPRLFGLFLNDMVEFLEKNGLQSCVLEKLIFRCYYLRMTLHCLRSRQGSFGYYLI